MTYILAMFLNALWQFHMRLQAWLAWVSPWPTYPWQNGAPLKSYDQLRRTAWPFQFALAIGIAMSIGSDPVRHWAAILGVMLVGASIIGMIIVYTRYVACWDELSRQIGASASALALVATTALLFINTLTATAHLPHMTSRWIAFIPLLAYWISVIGVRAHFGLLQKESAS